MFGSAPLALALLFAVPAPISEVAADEVQFLGTLSIPGNAEDLSGLTDILDGGIPHNQLGGFSAIAYTGSGNRYLVLPDRGPSDGAVPYSCRIQELELTVTQATDISDDWMLSHTLTATHLLTDREDRAFHGGSSEINHKHPHRSLRLDPEGLRVAQDGTCFVADEYGPHVFAFSPDGKWLRSISVPEHLKIARLSGSAEEEISQNKIGRQANRGFEGLAISPDGQRLYAILQGPLLQDHPFDASGKRLGRNVRLVEFDLNRGQTREFVYVIDKANYRISEILMLDDHRLLVLERDSKGGADAVSKRLYEVSLANATDVSDVRSLPAETLPSEIRPLSKTLYLDLLSAEYGLFPGSIPGKIEGLCLGPLLPDGRQLLLVCSDNDFVRNAPSLIYAFAVDMSRAKKVRNATSLLPLANGVRQIDGLTIRGDSSLYDGVPPANADGTFNAIVEIPSGTNAKWEVSKSGDMIWEVRNGDPRIVNFLPYPGNYGMIPGTLLSKEKGGDGDALDVLILSPAIPRGSVVKIHVIGMMKFLDDGEQDDKILAVMSDTPLQDVRSLKDLNAAFPGASEIVKSWFCSYKKPGKMVFGGWGEVSEAIELINVATPSQTFKR